MTFMTPQKHDDSEIDRKQFANDINERLAYPKTKT